MKFNLDKHRAFSRLRILNMIKQPQALDSVTFEVRLSQLISKWRKMIVGVNCGQAVAMPAPQSIYDRDPRISRVISGLHGARRTRPYLPTVRPLLPPVYPERRRFPPSLSRLRIRDIQRVLLPPPRERIYLRSSVMHPAPRADDCSIIPNSTRHC